MNIEDSKLKKITIISLIIILLVVFSLAFFDAWKGKRAYKIDDNKDLPKKIDESVVHPLNQDEIKQAGREATPDEKAQMKIMTSEEIQLAAKKTVLQENTSTADSLDKR